MLFMDMLFYVLVAISVARLPAAINGTNGRERGLSLRLQPTARAAAADSRAASIRISSIRYGP